MENFEHFSAFDFVTELPNELLNFSPLFQTFSPIHSPDATNKSFIELKTAQPICLPISSNIIEANFEEKISPEHEITPFQSLDPNTEHGRPKRAAALAANVWISNLNHTDYFTSPDKENQSYIKSQPRTNFGKKRESTWKKKSSPIYEENKKNHDMRINFDIDNKSLSDVMTQEILRDNLILSAEPTLEEVPVDFNQPNQQIGLEFEYNENLNNGLTYSNLVDPFLNNFVDPKCETMQDITNNLNTPTKTDKSLVFCLSDNLYYDDSNYEKDDFGFTISRAIEPKFESHETYLKFNLNNANEPLIDLNNNYLLNSNQQVSHDQNKTENEYDITENMLYEGIDLLKLKSVKRGSEPIGYALNVIKVLFTENEIKQGIFPDNKGKNRSKFRIPFDKNRTEILKEAIIKKFNYNPSSLKKIWMNIRPVLNRRLKNIAL